MSQTDEFITIKRKRRTKGRYMIYNYIIRVRNNKLADLLSGNDMYYKYNLNK